ncbi:hypothetical protein QBC33DRAFT_293707 [Phialemonium atrogriseum]|uniref:Uncharacterized protein n=1 Tax=Phialemonium atrogriseum TaxID=1093897 RepID=A0AAJ0BPC8_9PEZI|nr:uncharacterized protein QBC33DRAFT_293707 [Phialemonium atrogriseum]KAK1762009.1 hypothetical protein QBC33DRAFT_293707 [Phialemonium atrogriseum]
MSANDLVDRIDADLRRLDSRMKLESTDDDWHSRAARLLWEIFRKNQNIQGRLERLALIPGRFASSSIRWMVATQIVPPLCYPEVDGIPIPQALQLILIDKSAAQNPERRRLFNLLGVNTLSAKIVRYLIFAEHRGSNANAACQAHLWFLYQTHDSNRGDTYGDIHVFNQNLASVEPHATDVYVENEHPYGPRELLKATAPNPRGVPGSGAQGFAVQFINRCHFDDIPKVEESFSVVASMDSQLHWCSRASETDSQWRFDGSLQVLVHCKTET